MKCTKKEVLELAILLTDALDEIIDEKVCGVCDDYHDGYYRYGACDKHCCRPKECMCWYRDKKELIERARNLIGDKRKDVV